jgi:para-aminobenzoate synthetase
MPILGICLGHQALGYFYNVKVELAPNGPVHGLMSQVYHVPFQSKNDDDDDDGNDDASVGMNCDLFKGVDQSFDVVRYHSLLVNFADSELKSPELMIEPMAWCKSDTEAESGNGDDEICMALRHKVYPHYGVQFHPESVGTGENGYRIFQNFCEFCVDRRTVRDTSEKKDDAQCDRLLDQMSSKQQDNDIELIQKEELSSSKYKIFVRKMCTDGDCRSLPKPEGVFEAMYATMNDSFWLDSSTGRKDADLEEMNKPSAFGNDSSCPIVSNSRFSIMGGNLGPLCKKIEYWGKDHKVENRGLVVTNQMIGQREKTDCEQDIISFLHDEIMINGVTEKVVGVSFDPSNEEYEEIETELPFEYHGGYVGYLGYEVWHDTRDTICEQEACGRTVNAKVTKGCSNPLVPTAAFIFADRSLVYDHWRDEWYLVGVADATDESKEDVVQWMRDTSDQLLSIASLDSKQDTDECKVLPNEELNFDLKRTRDEYSADIARCHEEIRNGESYELCLTNQLTTQVSFPEASDESLSSTPFGLYKILRQKNPAPFAAFMKFDSASNHSDNNADAVNSAMSICCSSPERFLSVTKEGRYTDDEDNDSARDHGWEFSPPFVSKDQGTESRFIIESKPIKGTASRIILNKDDLNDLAKVEEDRRVAEELQKSVKNRAENLMIVDLLRNDLSRICEPGSVHVPKLMGIESFATVHQMVSTIRGIVDKKNTPIDVIAACFPGGSMTGAPKLRSVDILNDVELGQSRGPYSGSLGYISLNGSMDMNIVIRTALVTPNSVNKEQDSISWDVAIGAGGAITALSESQDEFEEMLLKARAIRNSVEQWNNGGVI